MLVLRLNKAGMPQEWVLPEEAARLYCQDKVLFELGATACTLHGGWNNAGIRSELTLSSIIACDGKVTDVSGKIALCNRYLFRRDDHLCLYCGQRFSPGHPSAPRRGPGRQASCRSTHPRTPHPNRCRSGHRAQ